MRLDKKNMFLVSVYTYIAAIVLVSSESSGDKQSKHFSLFSVVTFQNAECTATDTSLTDIHGTCYTTTECNDKGGSKSGNCASGFGVCCLFLNTAGVTSTITENRTRLRNSEYPSTSIATSSTTVVYTVNKMKSDICQLRLDFTNFVIAGPANTLESVNQANAILGTNCQDTLQITTTDVPSYQGQPSGVLCGALTGEHLYVDMTMTAADIATITLIINPATVAANIALRVWDVKLSQIECHATYKAPNGCQRYMTTDGGKIISYNFYETGAATQAGGQQNSGLELPLQRIKTCIRRNKGMCCTEYKPCASYQGIALLDGLHASLQADNSVGDKGVWNEAWSFDTMLWPFIENNIQENLGMADSQCLGDHVEIPSSWSAACGAGTSSARSTINSRYCGARLGFNGQQGTDTNTVAGGFHGSPMVCDCSEPFTVTHWSDMGNDKGGAGGVNAANTYSATSSSAGLLPRGFCLDYQQIPCWQ